MKPLEEIYSEKFFKNRHSLSWRAPIVCKAIDTVFRPRSIVDVGCAIGDYVREFLAMGIDAIGIEGSEAALPYMVVDQSKIRIMDLRDPAIQPPVAEFVLCLEVAEHIEAEHAGVFIDNLCKMAKRIILSAAPPGQKGHYHVNCQPQSYWIDKFEARGYAHEEYYVDWLKGLWGKNSRKEMSAYHKNLMIFRGAKK